MDNKGHYTNQRCQSYGKYVSNSFYSNQNLISANDVDQNHI